MSDRVTTDKRMLVVLDNAASADQARPLLPGGSRCLAVVTSRTSLTSLAAVEGADLIPLDVLTAAESHTLLTKRLDRDRLDAELHSVDEIIERCARLPLALAVVAAHAVAHPQHGLATIAEALRDAGGQLDAFVGTDPATDIRAVFSWSYRGVSPAAVRLFRLLSLHLNADIAFAAVVSLAGLPEDTVRSSLAELVRAHLLTDHRLGRYACHDLLRAYAAEHAYSDDPPEQRRAVVHRVLDHYLHTAYAADRSLNPTLSRSRWVRAAGG